MAKVCIDCRYIGPRPSGISQVAQALADFAPGLAPELDFILLRHPACEKTLSTSHKVEEITVPQSPNGPASMWWMSRLADLSQIGLFHATSNILPARLRMPTVTTIHDVMWLTKPQLCSDRPLSAVKRAFYAHGIKRALRKSSAIATVSEASKKEILALAPEAEDRLFVTRSGVSPDFRPVPIDWGNLANLGIEKEQRFVLTVGQYAPYKNHEGAIRAFALAFPSPSNINLILLQRQGGGARRLSALAQELGLAGRIIFLPAIGRDALIGLYSAASALLHPSFCEGFGNPLAEAMACGCPVITSNLSAMPEVTGDAALLVDPHNPRSIADALQEVLGNPEQSARMKMAGIARSEELSWRDFAEANVAIYRKLLADN